MTAHEFPEGDEPSDRCIHCGTTRHLHSQKEQPCVPHRTQTAEPLRPEPRRRIFACEDIDTIATRIAELRKEADEAMNHRSDE